MSKTKIGVEKIRTGLSQGILFLIAICNAYYCTLVGTSKGLQLPIHHNYGTKYQRTAFHPLLYACYVTNQYWALMLIIARGYIIHTHGELITRKPWLFARWRLTSSPMTGTERRRVTPELTLLKVRKYCAERVCICGYTQMIWMPNLPVEFCDTSEACTQCTCDEQKSTRLTLVWLKVGW